MPLELKAPVSPKQDPACSPNESAERKAAAEAPERKHGFMQVRVLGSFGVSSWVAASPGLGPRRLPLSSSCSLGLGWNSPTFIEAPRQGLGLVLGHAAEAFVQAAGHTRKAHCVASGLGRCKRGDLDWLGWLGLYRLKS